MALARAAKTATEVDGLIVEAKAEGAPEQYLADLTSIGAAKARDDGGLQERLSNPGDYGAMSARDVAKAEAAVLRRAVAEEQDEVIEPEIVNEDDPTEIWQQILAAAGRRGWSMDQTEDQFAQFSNGTAAGSAEVDELRAFLKHLKSAK
jgi:hypothetical protein